MLSPTPKQLQKLEKLAKVLDNGDIALLTELNALEDRLEGIETMLPALREAEDGEPGYTPVKGIDYVDGKDYVLTEQDKLDIAKSINVPVVEKVIIKEIPGETIREIIKQPIVTNEIVKEIKTVEVAVLDDATVGYLENEIKKLDKKHGGYGQVVRKLRAGTGVTIDETNLEYPVINATATGGGHTIEDEGTPLTQRDTINFTGSGVAVTDAGGKTVVTIGGGGSTAWGDITGTLSAQTDLQTALNNKAPSLGADDNYVTDAEKVKLSNLSGTNTGDQNLAPYLLSATAASTYEPLKGADDNFVTDAEKVVIGNTSGTNTGDNAANTTYASDYRAANFIAGTNYVAPNVAITGATKTKVTYDTKGLVTAGADATTADIADSLNKRYVTDANLTTIGNQSGTNTGDETTATIKTKLGITTLSGTNTGDQVIKDTFGITVDGAGTALTTGTKGYRYIEQNCTITGWHVRSDISGSVVFDVKRSGVSLAGSEKPTLTATTANSDLALSTWTTSLVAGDIIEFVIDSASTLTRATLTVLITKL